MQKPVTFEDRFLSKLPKIDRQEIEAFLSSLVREKHFLHIVFNALLDGILVLRPNLEVLFVNDVAIELLGINPRRKVVGERIGNLVSLAGFNELVTRFALQRERITHAELEPATSSDRALQISFLPLEGDATQHARSSIMIVHDVTVARVAAEEKRKAERATTLATLTAGLAHEIKNPLNSLQIHAQLLQRGLKDPKARKTDKARLEQSLDIILEEIRRLSGVVDDFLSAVRPTRPLVKLSDINRLVERAGETVRPEAESRGVILSVRLDHDIPSVEVDPNQVQQALLNLLKNALEALTSDPTTDRSYGAGCLTNRPSGTCRVEMRTELRGDHFDIHVADNGPGIPEDDLRKILEPYFTTKFSGTGLGLAIVSRIVEEHGGRLNIHSQPAQGTVITLSFPLDSRPVKLLEDDPPDSQRMHALIPQSL